MLVQGLALIFLLFPIPSINCLSQENDESDSSELENFSLYPVIMPMIVPAKDEVYLCTSVDLSSTNETFYIRGFEPRVSNGRIHHMALAGSTTKPPKTKFNLWNCGNNGQPAEDPNYPNHGVFPDAPDGKDTTIYLWGMGGKRTMLPQGTGFKVSHMIRSKHSLNCPVILGRRRQQNQILGASSALHQCC